MIQAEQFDVKTGKPIQVVIDGQWQTAIKQIEYSYLEHWCLTNGIETAGRFSVAQFYESVHDADRRQLESEGKYLVFSSGSEGYFTDSETAQLMTLGSQTVEPIYAGDRNAAHNAVAYGGLIASDGVASTAFSSARVLVIDNVKRTHGSEPLVGWDGQLVSEEELQPLYDKMGDGTMLIRSSTMDSLTTSDEREQITVKAFAKAGISADITNLGADLDRVDQAADVAIASVDRRLGHQADTGVYQFRAASPDFPGIAKGTVTYSSWAERLNVDAIISIDDIKGDDGRFSEPGIKEASNFWVNRKATASYGQQTVGPQVKYTIPEATRLEINPRVQEKAEQLAQVAGNYDALSQRYLKHKEHERERSYQSAEENLADNSRPDWLYNALSSDKYGQLTDQASVVRGLEYYIKGEWQRLSANGTSVPSAMAQHHSQLKPWEVCNKDLPHGAIVAYYRSPFPNVGAAAIAINNRRVIEQQDKEAFSKQGVAYLPPDTAKSVAITDFDGDINGFFVGYEATVDDLPEQLREKLVGISGLSSEQQYEAGRAAFEEIIQRSEQGHDSSIKQSVYPVAVKEFIERTAPAVKPPQIIKQQKEKHSWQKGESHSEATWRAWGVTADNPTGKVANAGMSLQSLALELEYAPDERKSVLLDQLSSHCSDLLEKVDAGKIVLPDDDWLAEQGFSPYYRETLEDLAEAKGEVASYGDVQRQQEATEMYLRDAHSFLKDVANGPNAVNLQTAVDTAKSAKGIDENLHSFVEALQYKEDDFRRNKNNPSIYVDGKEMPTSIHEPVSWGVQQVNEQYSGAQLQERENKFFQGVFPMGEAPQQTQQAKTIIQTSSGLMKQAVENKARHRQRRSEDQRPTIQVATADGRQLALQNIEDAQGAFPWRSDGPHPDWKISISKNYNTKKIGERFPVELSFVDAQGQVQTEPIGYVDRASAERFGLEERFKTNKSLTIREPHLTMQVPWAQQNDSKTIYAQRDRYLEKSLAPPDGKDPQLHSQEMAIALWRQSKGGRKLMMQEYPEVLSDRLQNVPDIKVGRLQLSSEQAQRLAASSPHTIQFANDTFSAKGGDVTERSVSVLKASGARYLIGAVSGGSSPSISLPEAAIYTAAFTKDATSEKIVHMQVMDLPVIEQTPNEIAALRAGRSHLTLDHNPQYEYGLRAGSVVIAQSEPDGEQIALRVSGQHVIDGKLAATHSQQWADAEKAPASALFDKLTAARTDGAELWGLSVQPLGTYVRGQVLPFKEATQVHQIVSTSAIQSKTQVSSVQQSEQSPVSTHQPVRAESTTQQLWEKYSRQNSGVMAAIASRNPQLQSNLDREMAKCAIGDGHPLETIQRVIAQHSPEAKKSAQPDVYAKKIVEKEAQASRKQIQNQSVSRSKSRSQKRDKSKRNQMSR